MGARGGNMEWQLGFSVARRNEKEEEEEERGWKLADWSYQRRQAVAGRGLHPWLGHMRCSLQSPCQMETSTFGTQIYLYHTCPTRGCIFLFYRGWGERKISVLVGITTVFTFHVAGVYWWYRNDDVLYPLVMLPPKEIPPFWHAIFVIIVNDMMVRQAAMVLKCLLLMYYENGRGCNYCRQVNKKVPPI
ncbi:hypothetical protein Taro_010821 [Colocasia esculenta]|uniref:Uncharacterized protein n=1 Tax=Colocasia esculenta TaxID=4460 RepID=A0A843U439_COLES|nr:hypothetical protein [Colocasia esculenta]